MGNKRAQGRLSARRAATFLAALGVLVMSSGAALMVTATPANADAGPSVCHPVNGNGELGNGWDLISPDHASSHIDESLYPDGHYWKHESKDGRHDVYAVDGQCPSTPAPETQQAVASAVPVPPTCEHNVASYTTAGSVGVASWDESAAPAFNTTITVTAHAADGYAFGESSTKEIEVSFGSAKEGCTVVSAPITASVSFTEPTCTTPGSYAGTNTDKVKYALTSGSVAPGADVVVTASPIGEDKITGQTVFPHKFATPTGCSTVSAPTPQVESSVVVSPPKAHVKTKTHAAQATVTPTVVEAGLASTTAQDLRGEQGLALVFAGMVMLLAAGGLGLRIRSSAARI